MVNSIGNNSAITASYTQKSSKIPAVPDLLTSGQSDMGDSEIEKKIMEMARRDVAAGTNSKFAKSKRGSGTDEWFKLEQDYVSAVSPDRKGIITKSLSNLASKMGSMQIKFNSRNFFQVLFQNNRLFGSDVGGNFINFKDSGGNTVATYGSLNGWITHTTPDENQRITDFIAMWDKAIATAQQELNSGVNDGVDIKA